MKFLFWAILAALFLTACQSTPQESATTTPDVEPTKTLNDYLMGSWESMDDSLYHIHFEGGYYYSDYAGVQDPSARYQLVDSCQGTKQGNIMMTSLPDGTPMCYDVIKADETSLEMIYLDRGNTLRFRRD